MSWPLQEFCTNKLGSILTIVSEPEDKEIQLVIEQGIFHSPLEACQEYTVLLYITPFLITWTNGDLVAFKNYAF